MATFRWPLRICSMDGGGLHRPATGPHPSHLVLGRALSPRTQGLTAPRLSSDSGRAVYVPCDYVLALSVTGSTEGQYGAGSFTIDPGLRGHLNFPAQVRRATVMISGATRSGPQEPYRDRREALSPGSKPLPV